MERAFLFVIFVLYGYCCLLNMVHQLKHPSIHIASYRLRLHDKSLLNVDISLYVWVVGVAVFLISSNFLLTFCGNTRKIMIICLNNCSENCWKFEADNIMVLRKKCPQYHLSKKFTWKNYSLIFHSEVRFFDFWSKGNKNNAKGQREEVTLIEVWTGVDL